MKLKFYDNPLFFLPLPIFTLAFYSFPIQAFAEMMGQMGGNMPNHMGQQSGCPGLGMMGNFTGPYGILMWILGVLLILSLIVALISFSIFLFRHSKNK